MEDVPPLINKAFGLKRTAGKNKSLKCRVKLKLSWNEDRIPFFFASKCDHIKDELQSEPLCSNQSITEMLGGTSNGSG